jgi:hypothetical protein
MRGIGEHLERAQYLFGLAQNEKDGIAKYRLMLAAIYSCRAITELMLEAAKKQEVKGLDDADPDKNRAALEGRISPMLPYYALIERIRIHDFHRFGVVPPDPRVREVMFGGPVRLTAQKGAASVALTSEGPQYRTTGNSKKALQRPLLADDGLFFDDDSSRYVSLEEVLKAFLSACPEVISALTSSHLVPPSAA